MELKKIYLFIIIILFTNKLNSEIIKPNETRKVVSEAFKELVNKTNIGDKHGNIPL